MRIINKDNGAVLADSVQIADTPLTRSRGLLGRQSLAQGEALVIRPCNSVHTFFMRFDIDVLFLDRDNRVVKALSCLKPFRLTPIFFKARLAIEFPAGTIASTSTRISDNILIE